LPDEHASYDTAKDRAFFLKHPTDPKRFVHVMYELDEGLPPDVSVGASAWRPRPAAMAAELGGAI
jgi:hypothetical protein